MDSRKIPYASLLLLLAACGKDSHGHDKQEPITQYRPPNARPDYWGSPEATVMGLSDGKAFTEADKAATDSIVEYHQRVYEQSPKTLAPGYVPRAYLARPGIEFVENTGGEVKGFEEMRTVLNRIQDNCGVFLPSRSSGLQLTVHWTTKSIMRVLSGEGSGGNFMSGAMTGIHRDYNYAYDHPGAPPRKRLGYFHLASPENKLHLNAEAFAYDRPENRAALWPEMLRGWEQGQKKYQGNLNGYCNDPTNPRGNYADQTFAHELGHAYFTEWALLNGRSTFQTVKFREMFAETFADICYRDVSKGCEDNWGPYTSAGKPQEMGPDGLKLDWRAELSYLGHLVPIGETRPILFDKAQHCGTRLDCTTLSLFERMDEDSSNTQDTNFLSPYTVHSRPFNMPLLAYLKYTKQWPEGERKRLLAALTAALADMKGEKLPECAPELQATKWNRLRQETMKPYIPVETKPHPYAGVCPWGGPEKDLPMSQAERPLVFTARELFRTFEKHWPWPKEARDAYASNRDYMNTVWEY
jgi:hypothetical protein